MKNHHLLLIRFSALGDVAMTVPVIRSLYHTYPDLKITFVSRPYVAPLFAEFDNFDFYPTDFKNRHSGIKGLWTLFQELKKIPFSGVADLHGVLRTHLLGVFFRINGMWNLRRLSFHRRNVNNNGEHGHYLYFITNFYNYFIGFIFWR